MIPSPMPPQSERSLSELLGELTQDIVTLVRQEMILAKAEISQKAVRIGKNIGLIAGGALIGYAGLLTILVALVLLLAQVIVLWASALIIGVVVTLVGAALASRALGALRNENLVPQQTLKSLQEIKNG